MAGLVFDIGGTNLRMAITNGESIGTPVRQPVPRTFAGVVAALNAVGRSLTGKKRMTAAAGGLAGPLDRKKTGLARSTHLPYLVGKPMQQTLERLWKVPVTLENDNALAGIGEAVRGPGKGHAIVAYIGIGTGIGGVRIVDGKVDRNAHGFEPGHHFLNYDVTTHSRVSAHPGDWESIVSGSGMAARFGKNTEDIGNKKIWNEMAMLVAFGLINVAMFWSPHIIVIGGSLMKSVSLAAVRKHANRHQKIFPATPPIVRGVLGDDAGLYGAAHALAASSVVG